MVEGMQVANLELFLDAINDQGVFLLLFRSSFLCLLLDLILTNLFSVKKGQGLRHRLSTDTAKRRLCMHAEASEERRGSLTSTMKNFALLISASVIAATSPWLASPHLFFAFVASLGCNNFS
jgi:hypothetical protein